MVHRNARLSYLVSPPTFRQISRHRRLMPRDLISLAVLAIKTGGAVLP